MTLEIQKNKFFWSLSCLFILAPALLDNGRNGGEESVQMILLNREVRGEDNNFDLLTPGRGLLLFPVRSNLHHVDSF